MASKEEAYRQGVEDHKNAGPLDEFCHNNGTLLDSLFGLDLLTETEHAYEDGWRDHAEGKVK